MCPVGAVSITILSNLARPLESNSKSKEKLNEKVNEANFLYDLNESLVNIADSNLILQRR